MMYRSEFFLNIIGTLLFIYVQISIWCALLPSYATDAIVGSGQMVTFVIVSYLLRQASRTYFTRAFETKINHGNISIDLIRPISLKFMMFAEQLSENLSMILFACIPAAIISGFVWGIELVVGIPNMLLFGLSVLLAITLQFYIEYIAGMCVFWTRDSVYTSQALGGLILIFSGSTVPLWFYPDWLNIVGLFLPFRLMAFEPIRIFMGHADLSGAIEIIAHQALWIVGLYVLERLVWREIQNNVFIQGG